MASSFTFAESYGTSSGGDISYINLLNGNVSSGSDTSTATAANPIPIPASATNYSYERWVRGHWSGTFSTITSLKFWKSNGSLGTGVAINAAVKTPNPTTFVTPTGGSGGQQTQSSYATAAVPTSSGSALAPTFNSGSTGTPATTNCSDFLILQAAIASTAGPGTSATQTFTMQWNET